MRQCSTFRRFGQGRVFSGGRTPLYFRRGGFLPPDHPPSPARLGAMPQDPGGFAIFILFSPAIGAINRQPGRHSLPKPASAGCRSSERCRSRSECPSPDEARPCLLCRRILRGFSPPVLKLPLKAQQSESRSRPETTRTALFFRNHSFCRETSGTPNPLSWR